MKITEITEAGKGKHIITNEDGYFVCLYYKELKGLEFEVDKDTTKERWAIANKSVITRGKKRIFHLLARKDYTESEIRKKLIKEYYDEDNQNNILDYFRELGYIDDVKYVTKFYNYHKGSKSRLVIEQKLKLKGIPDPVLKEVLAEEVGEKDAYIAARAHAFKKYGNKDMKEEDYPKMVQFLMRKGFHYPLCKKIITEILNGTEEEDEY